MSKIIEKVIVPVVTLIIIAALLGSALGISLLMFGWIWTGVQSVWSMIF